MTKKSEDPFHLYYTKDAKLVGKYQFAQLEPNYYPLPERMKCISERIYDYELNKCGLHFFVDDYRFESLWVNCDKRIEKLKQLPLVIGPDYSLYRDMEEWRRIYNCGRNNAICYYLAKQGVKVIPVASWAFLADLEWSLDGFQEGCTLAVSNNGCLLDPTSRNNFIAGLSIIQRKLKPKRIYICGKKMCELARFSNIKYFLNFSERKFGKEQ